MKLKILSLFGLATLLFVIQFSQNEFIEPNPVQVEQLANYQGPSLPFRISSYFPTNAQYLLIVNARNTATMERIQLREKQPYYYRVNLSTGEMQTLDYRENLVEGISHCLTVPQKQQLTVILRESQICESPEVEELARNISCQMNYTAPFAILRFDGGKRVNLGEKNSGCDFPTSLCGSANEKLIQWSRSVLVSIKELSCSIPERR
jgi:hypothetical protein